MFSRLPPRASALQPDAEAALQKTLVKAVACRNAYGAEWEPIVNDALANLEAYLLENEPDMAKVDLDVILAERLDDGKKLPVTDELRSYCRRVMSSGG